MASPAKNSLQLILLIFLANLAGCKTPPTSQDVMEERKASAKPSRATVWTDMFYATQPSSPERPVERQEFFNDCELVRKSRFTSRSEYSCGE